jgi:hypothetical protein
VPIGPVFSGNRFEKDQPSIPELVASIFHSKRKQIGLNCRRVLYKHIARPIVQRRRNNIRLGSEGIEDFLCNLGVLESQWRGAVVGDHRR